MDLGIKESLESNSRVHFEMAVESTASNIFLILQSIGRYFDQWQNLAEEVSEGVPDGYLSVWSWVQEKSVWKHMELCW